MVCEENVYWVKIKKWWNFIRTWMKMMNSRDDNRIYFEKMFDKKMFEVESNSK